MRIASNTQERPKPSEREGNIVPALNTDWRAQPTPCPNKDVFDEPSEATFPASDAPSWTVVTGTGTPRQLEGG